MITRGDCVFGDPAPERQSDTENLAGEFKKIAACGSSYTDYL
jgi:translation initiation factor 1 (eIF-1/SUI1)